MGSSHARHFVLSPHTAHSNHTRRGQPQAFPAGERPERELMTSLSENSVLMPRNRPITGEDHDGHDVARSWLA